MTGTISDSRDDGGRPVSTAPPPSSGVEVSVVMPCLDEARTVGRCIDKAWTELRRLGVTAEVIVADNGSTDGSREVAERHGARVVDVAPRGYGNALRAGIEAARGRYVIIGDADDSYDFGDLEPFLRRLEQGDEMVIGNRFRGGIRPGAMPRLHRYLGNPLLTGILNVLYRSPVGDAHCGMRAFEKAAYDRLSLRSEGMEFASEMIVRACLGRLRVSEVPIVLYPDGRGRPPHLRSFRDGWRHLRFLFLLCPLWMFLVPSLVLLGSGAALMLWLSSGPRPVGPVVLDVHTMLLGSLCVILGYQTFWFWACAQAYGPQDPGRADGHPPRASGRAWLDRAPLAGGVLISIGLAFNLWLVNEWRLSDLKALEVRTTLRHAIWGLTLLVVGAQTIFGSFFLAMIEDRFEGVRRARGR